MNSEEIVLKGVPICRGIAIGKPFFLTRLDDNIPEYKIAAHHVEAEISRYRQALHNSREDIRSLQQRLEQDKMLDTVSILETQLLLTQDPILTTQVENTIYSTCLNAESVFHSVVTHYREKFSKIADPFFQERFKDVQDISRRVIRYLRAGERISLADLPPDSIIFSHELTTTDAIEANISCVHAFVTEVGSPTSHAAIVAKARGTPYVSNIAVSRHDVQKYQLAIVDGRTGDIILNPSENTIAIYQQARNQLDSHSHALDRVSTLKAETFDGYAVRLSANIEMASELEMLHQHGGQGVGLFRSEYLFLDKDKFPSEEEQYIIYKELVDKMHGLPIVIRTFDIGGDKFLANQTAPFEVNPFLGCRAIRFLLREKDIFKAQLRAILRAAAYGNVSIMFPMISTLSELVEARAIISQVQEELNKKDIRQGPVRIGCMIEVPSAAIIADLLARECDFLSIGTNDLVQYALAVDRNNHAMNALYSPTHPSVLRLIKMIIHEASHHGIPVSICGEVAADPRFTPLLLGLGVHELSVATRYIPTVKNAIRSTSIVAASRLADKALTLTTAAEIQELLAQEYRKIAPDDCLYNCG